MKRFDLSLSLPPDAFIGRVMLIDGASGGLGQALAQALAGRGAHLILLGRTPCRLEKTYDAVLAAGGAEPLMQPVNYEGMTLEDYANLAQAVVREFGRLDAVALLSASSGQSAPLALADPVQWARSLHVNLSAPFLLAQAMLPLLRQGREPALLFGADAGPAAYGGAYAVAKAGVERMVRMWAEELSGMVCVNALDSGPLSTGLRARQYPGEVPGSAPDPRSAVPAALALLAPGCSVNGETVRLGMA